MAVSFSRPDPSAPASVAEATFASARRGFDQGEVRDFLRMVAAELGRLQERERFLERELRAAQTNPDFSSATLDDMALTRLLGEETARVLTTARESAAEIREKAEQAAAQLLAEANDEARRVREEADVEASRRRSDAASDAEAELAMAKQQGREMVNEARAYRERVLSELARRRELAREQIEQLIHGRDRLIQVFERARLVASDVVSELQPLGEPDEYVNLSPTTGPVPVMVKNGGPPTEQIAALPLEERQVPTGVEVRDVDAMAAHPASSVAGDAPYDHDSDPDPDPDPDPSADGGLEAIADADVEHVVEGELAVDVDTAAEGAPETEHEPPAGEARSDDVVVDLFARLRAEADQPQAEGTSGGEPSAADPESGLDDDNPFRRRDAELTPLIVASARKLKRALADEQNGVLDALRRQQSVRSLDDILPPLDDHVAHHAAAIADDVMVAAHAGASLVSGDSVVVLPKAHASASSAAATAVLADWVIAPLRERLDRVIADGDGDNDAITKRTRAVYREWKTQHIDAHLDDVLRAAHGRGLIGVLAQNEMVVWTADDDDVPCADCNDNVLAGPVTLGSELPTGHDFAPAHPGCRCLLLPTDR
jgi:DivIVA domain-containing protein